MIWCCPACRAPLSAHANIFTCAGCARIYETVDGIPDLRYPRPQDEVTANDLAQADEISSSADDRSDEDLVRAFFAVREGVDGWTRADTELRARYSVAAAVALRTEIEGWMSPVTSQPTFLDLGCGLGGLLSAAHDAERNGIGIDNRMSVLVIAKRILERRGSRPVLACANAEALPLPDSSVGGVVMYDVVEHIERIEGALAEVSRVTRAGGAFACSTPNRYSLAPEPHVHVWGVGWMPRKYQAAYVRFLSGRKYEGTRLLSPQELKDMLRRSTRFDVEMRVPPVPAMEVERSRGPRKLAVRIFNAISQVGIVRPVLLRIGPFFQLIAVKRADAVASS